MPRRWPRQRNDLYKLAFISMNYYSWVFDSTEKSSVWDYFKKGALVEEQAKGRFSPERAMIVDMPPDLYLTLAEPIKSDDSKRHADLGKKVSSGEIKQFDTIPALLMRIMEDGNDAKVYGHDGRHRAILMKEKGFKTIPVALYWENTCWETLPEDKKGNKFYPKSLWCQNDKAVQREVDKVPFPVKEEDWGRPYDLKAEKPDDDADMSVKAVKPDENGEEGASEVNDSMPFVCKVPDFCAKPRDNFTNHGNRPFNLPFSSYMEFLRKNNREAL